METNELEAAADFTLRVYVLAYMFNDVCRCHLYTDPANRCARCDILLKAGELWPYEYRLTFQSYNEMKNEAIK